MDRKVVERQWHWPSAKSKPLVHNAVPRCLHVEYEYGGREPVGEDAGSGEQGTHHVGSGRIRFAAQFRNGFHKAASGESIQIESVRIASAIVRQIPKDDPNTAPSRRPDH